MKKQGTGQKAGLFCLRVFVLMRTIFDHFHILLISCLFRICLFLQILHFQSHRLLRHMHFPAMFFFCYSFYFLLLFVEYVFSACPAALLKRGRSHGSCSNYERAVIVKSIPVSSGTVPEESQMAPPKSTEYRELFFRSSMFYCQLSSSSPPFK